MNEIYEKFSSDLKPAASDPLSQPPSTAPSKKKWLGLFGKTEEEGLLDQAITETKPVPSSKKGTPAASLDDPERLIGKIVMDSTKRAVKE